MGENIRLLAITDAQPIAAAFATIGWSKPAEQFRRYFSEQQANERVVFVAERDGMFAGYVTLNRNPRYAPFRTSGVPLIEDLNVLPQFRRRGLGTALVGRAEEAAVVTDNRVGIGVGLTRDYGAAQRLYVRLGYIPDGNGIAYKEQPVPWGEQIVVDDALLLYLVKRLDI